jgi:hypothetical protein
MQAGWNIDPAPFLRSGLRPGPSRPCGVETRFFWTNMFYLKFYVAFKKVLFCF